MVVLVLLGPLVAGLLSTIVPGDVARGPFKSWLVAFAGWLALGVPLVIASRGTFPASLGSLGGALEDLIVALAGACLIRLVFWPFERS